MFETAYCARFVGKVCHLHASAPDMLPRVKSESGLSR